MSAQKPRKTKITAEKLGLYEKLIATNPEIESKDANHPYTSLSGNMFTYMDPNSGMVAIRLPEGPGQSF
jgi:hypothetical protein